MNIEEKRELRIQIGQMLADAGVNQKTLKEMVVEAINDKVDRAVKQSINRLNADSLSGDFARDHIQKLLNTDYLTKKLFKEAVYEAIKEKVVKVSIEDC